MKLRTVDFDPFIRIGNVARIRRYPMADDRCADGVGDELVLRAVPGEDDRTGTPSAIQFLHINRSFGRDVQLVLRHAGRPQQPNNHGLTPIAETRENAAWPLAEIAACSRNLPLLPET